MEFDLTRSNLEKNSKQQGWGGVLGPLLIGGVKCQVRKGDSCS